MSLSAISASSLSTIQSAPISPTRLQQFKQDFQQLGQDLESGNLSAAQAAFAAIPKPGQGQSSTSAPVEQAFDQLGQNLHSGNLASAQQDFIQIKTDIQHREPGNNPLRPAPVYPVGPAPRVPVILDPIKVSVTA